VEGTARNKGITRIDRGVARVRGVANVILGRESSFRVGRILIKDALQYLSDLEKKPKAYSVVVEEGDEVVECLIQLALGYLLLVRLLPSPWGVFEDR